MNNMDIVKNKEHHKDPIKTAKRNCFALGAFQVFIGVVFMSKGPAVISVAVMGLFLLVAGYLLAKNKIAGVYLSWVYVVIGAAVSIFNVNIIAIIIVAYLAYWTYKAQKDFSNKDVAESV